MKNILLIPHTSTLKVRNRLFEIGKALHKKGFNIYYWKKQDVEKPTLIKKIRIAISEFIRVDEVTPLEAVNILRTSQIYRPYFLAGLYQEYMLNRILKHYDIDVVISAIESINLSLNEFSGKLILDYYDDITEYPSLTWKEKKKIIELISSTLKKSHLTLASSECILEKLLNEWKVEENKIIFLPNGIWLNDYKKYDDINEYEIRERYKLPENKKIVSFIGNHSEWTGIDFIYDIFIKYKEELEDFLLLIVGPTYKHFKEKSNIKILGPVSWDRVGEIIKISFCGVLPFKISGFTENALPLKVLEYTASRKPMLCSPLAQLKKLKWDNLFLIELEEKKWVESLIALDKYNVSFPSEIVYYDWSSLINRLIIKL